MKPDIDGFFGGFYIHRMDPAPTPGNPRRGHRHYIPHVGNLLAGVVDVHWIEGDDFGTVRMVAPCKLHMPANRHHTIEAITEVVEWECWFSEAEADKVHGKGVAHDYYMLEVP